MPKPALINAGETLYFVNFGGVLALYYASGGKIIHQIRNGAMQKSY